MKRQQRHNKRHLLLRLICTCLLEIMALGITMTVQGEASLAANTGNLLHQGDQGPDLCALIRQVAGDQSINISGGGAPDYNGCNAVNLESDRTKSRFDSIYLLKADSQDTAHAQIEQEGEGCKSAAWGDIGFECSHTGGLIFARGCYLGSIGVNDDNVDGSREVARSLAGALPGSCPGDTPPAPAIPAIPAPTSTGTATGTPAESANNANSNIVMEVNLTSEYSNSEVHTWPYDKGSQVSVSVYPWDNATGQPAPTDPSQFNPVQVTLFYDGNQIGSGETAQNGFVYFGFTPPSDTPEGLTHHKFKAVVSKQGFDTVEATRDFDIARDLQAITVSVEGIDGVHRPDETITIKGQVWAEDRSGLFTSPVAANLLVSGPGSTAVGTSDDSGYFSVDLSMNASQSDVATNGAARIWISAKPVDQDHFYEGQGFLQVLVSGKGVLSVTAAANKGIYSPDEPVTISGRVTADGNPIAASVDVVVNGSVLVGTAQAGDDGQYQYTFVPSSVPAKPQNPGQVPPGQRNPIPGSVPNPNPIIPLQVSSTYVVAVTPFASGYLAGADGDAYFTVSSTGEECQAQEMFLSQMSGTVLAQLSNAQAGQINTSPFSHLQSGMSVTQNMQILTQDSGRATFNLSLGGADQAIVAISGDTTLQIGTYCRDSSGKVHIVLLASKPGQLLVQWPPNTNAEIKIYTPSGTVSSVHTRYFISVDSDGTTSVTGLEGTARLTDEQGATVDVEAGNQVTVPPGQSVSGVVPVAAQGQVDPSFLAMLPPADTANSNSSTSGSPNFAPPRPTLSTPYMPWLIAGSVIALLAIVLGFVLVRSRKRVSSAVSPVASSAPMPMQAQSSDPFASVEAQYQRMRAEMAAGHMTQQQYQTMLLSMSVRDAYGRTWMLDGNTGRWLVYDGARWVYADPRQPG